VVRSVTLVRGSKRLYGTTDPTGVVAVDDALLLLLVALQLSPKGDHAVGGLGNVPGQLRSIPCSQRAGSSWAWVRLHVSGFNFGFHKHPFQNECFSHVARAQDHQLIMPSALSGVLAVIYVNQLVYEP
jgi:hypothetical protein